MEGRRKGRRIRARSPRVDSTYDAKCATGGKNRGIRRRPPEASYRGVHSISAYPHGNMSSGLCEKYVFGTPFPARSHD